GTRVLVTPGRAERPDQFQQRPWQQHGPEGCPFCEGSESMTPEEVEADRPDGSAPNGPGWQTRTVPNLYPALIPPEDATGESEHEAGAFASTADPLLASARSAEPDMFSSRPAIGAHEVIINSPRHVSTLGQLSEEELKVTVAAWRRRMNAHAGAPYVQLVLNEGPDTGATIEHSHAQVGAAPFVPAAVARERERFNSYRERTAGASLLGEVLREEIRRGERLVAIDDEVALICPWASRFPYEMRLIPRRPQARFEEGKGGAAMLGRAIAALGQMFGEQPQLNLWVKTAPRGVEHFHWHLDLIPRLTPTSAFEFATGVDINVIAPETAAQSLREAMS
ncbi:MAG: galactose-1-phosphate uridylyltransferase, partial [Solirubrobacterales bacterium]